MCQEKRRTKDAHHNDENVKMNTRKMRKGTMQRYTIIVLGLITTVLYGVKSDYQCLGSTTLKSFCFVGKDNFIRCNGITKTDTLNHVLRAIEGCKVGSLKLELMNLKLEKLPRGIFNGTRIDTLVFKNFSLSQLTDDEPGPSPFLGLENSLHTLGIIGAKNSIRHWNWNELSQLRSLQTLSFGRNIFSIISHTFSLINNSSLSWLQITGSCVDEIERYALGNFYKLVNLNLEGNLISSVTRATFPNLAPKLKLINLNYNLLDVLGEGTFSNMPALRTIYLNGNRFNVIQELVFSPIWNQLDYLLFYGNPIRCDCKIDWIINKKPKYVKNGQPLYCQQPTHLKGRDIQYLVKKDVCLSRHEGNSMSTAEQKKNTHKDLTVRCTTY